MRKPLLVLCPLLVAGILSQSGCGRSEAQTTPPAKEFPSSPPLGTTCFLKFYHEGESITSGSLRNVQPDVNGTLVSISDDWVCVKEGTYEHWVPRARVLELKLSR